MDQGIFCTGSVYIAAFLVALNAGTPKTQIVGRGRPLVEFWWPDPDGRIAKLALGYHNRATVEARRYTQAVRDCRDLIDSTLAGAR